VIADVLLLTPQMGGADGVSELSRQAVAAFEAQIGATVASLEVWSLTDRERPQGLAPQIRFRTAEGSRFRFGMFALGARHGAASTLVVVIHAHLLPVTLPLLASGARLACMLLGIEAWKPLTLLQRAAMRRAWRIGAISHHTAARFREANPAFARMPIHLCHLGARLQPMLRLPSQPKHPPFALIVGRMSSAERYKGHDELLQAWPRVRARVPAARLVIAGGGDDRARLEAKARALGIAGSVAFEGIVSQERLTALYREAAVFAMPSANEGFGLVYVEAMAAGTPCIAATGAAEEVVADGVSGRIVPPRDVEALAAVLIELLDDAGARDRMGRAALHTAHTRFSAAAFAERWCAWLEIGPVAGPRQVRKAVREAAC
jgi:phosphatidylinositol alpha-1,6-mannosyltransferase